MTKPYFQDESITFARNLELLRGHRIVVLGHRRPDGDCIGSQVALVRVLIAAGIESVAVNIDPIPRTLKAFVGDTPFYLASDLPTSEYLAVSVDCADHARVGHSVRDRFPHVRLNIDHHVSNTLYGETNLILPTACATGEILAGLFFDNDLTVDSIAAQALYLGIATDTGQFCYSGTTASVFDICRRLCELGASPSQAAHELYECEKPGRIQLLQRFLASFRMEHENRVCIGSITDDFYEETGTTPEDAENFVDYSRSLAGVEIGSLLEERNGQLKGSLRAKENRYRVDLLAKRFSGGGHACASGFNVERKLESFYPEFVTAIGEHLMQVETGGLT
jgi:phosphoesterase RecJ-like protein